jgi:hypothetical protein
MPLEKEVFYCDDECNIGTYEDLKTRFYEIFDKFEWDVTIDEAWEHVCNTLDEATYDEDLDAWVDEGGNVLPRKYVTIVRRRK